MSMRMLRYTFLTFLFCGGYSYLDKNRKENDGVVNYSSRDTWTEDDVELNTDVFPGIQSTCLHFSVESIKFDLPGNWSFNSSWLMEEYTNHKPTVHGCHSKSVKIHLQYQYGNHSNNNLFTFNATFEKRRRPNECSEDTWSMTQLSHENLTTSDLYVYKTNKVTADNDCCYYCSQISFTSESGDAKITLTNTTIQPFLGNGTKLSSRMIICRKTYDYDYLTYLISGGMGVSVILAIIVIIISCLTKRLKYGKYNLLDT